MNVDEAARTCEGVLEAIGSAVIGERELFETILTAVVGQGHVLLEDVPGTGKTLTARTLATALDLEFARIQFTPDLLPADITGTHVYDEHAGEFSFEAGPIFANVVLADEINRAPPKTQAALLEAMGEGQVSIGGETRDLPDPFFVIATQNPVEQEGTFPLPEAQVDRFMVKTKMGYPDRAGDLELLDRRASRDSRTPTVGSVVDRESVLDLQSVPETVAVEPPIREYLVDVCRATRDDERVDVGISPRGLQRLFEASRARATLSGRDYVAPEDVRAVVHPVLDHRLVLTTEADVRGVDPRTVVESALESVPVPSMDD
ncbi:AAA family ATPase [Natronolimnohabitans innermongolicus]|uniref:ATPase AAA n=1 Tax=Natronolimnohabitans innermongolicus JCM 12255 TaxID=1227499 RepID=L9WV06_9EURY|nr:MoxR family ATPase [Natronolimnohabitans innermongolicus]ELY53257.1 ATPase AAA [Natronolimnohabitans innermongolicus JCM 12255]